MRVAREYFYADQPVRRSADFSAWLAAPAARSALGRTYASELARHFRA